MSDAVILSAVRTPVAKGKPDGALARAGVLPTDIAALVIKASVERAGVPLAEVDDVVLGCAMPEGSRDRWRRVGHDIYATVSGYVTGNLVISAICGVVYGVALAILGVPYALALGFIAAVLDLIPLAGATIGGLLVVGEVPGAPVVGETVERGECAIMVR